MNFNTDGFNERSNYIHNSNDMNKINKNGPSNFDSSFAKMRIEEHKNDVITTNNDKVVLAEEVRGKKENFIVRTSNMRNINNIPNSNNPVSQALNRNLFKK